MLGAANSDPTVVISVYQRFTHQDLNVISDLDISRTANVLIREPGEGSAFEASQRADAMLEKGDMDG